MASSALTSSSAPPRPWRTVALLAAGLALEVAVLDRCFGEQVLQIPEAFGDSRWLRKDILVAVLAAGGLLFAHARSHADAYRLARLPLARLAVHAAAFAALVAFLLAMNGGVPQARFGTDAARWIGAGLVAAWLATLPGLLPAGIHAWRTALAAAGAAAAVLAAIRLGTTVSETFWYVTGDATVWLVEQLITPFAGAPIVRPDALTIGTENFNVFVGAGCSGYQGITLIILLFSGYLWWFRRLHRFPQSFLLFPLGIGLIFLSNIVRIAALILVGIWISPTIAVDGFHSQAGWVAFLVVGLGIIAAASRMPFFTLPVEDEHATGGVPGSTAATAAAVRAASATAPTYGPTVAACLFPFLAMLASTILTELFAEKGTLSKGYPLRVIAIAAVLWNLRHEFRWREATLSPVAVALGGLTCVMWMLLAPSDPEKAATLDPAQLGLGWGSAWLLMRFIGYMILAPIAEELAFRGFLARRLISEDAEQVPIGSFTWVSFLGSSLAFGLFHGVQLWFPATLAGIAFAAALYHRRKLVDAIVAHATTNALLGFYAVFTGAWDLG